MQEKCPRHCHSTVFSPAGSPCFNIHARRPSGQQLPDCPPAGQYRLWSGGGGAVRANQAVQGYTHARTLTQSRVLTCMTSHACSALNCAFLSAQPPTWYSISSRKRFIALIRSSRVFTSKSVGTRQGRQVYKSPARALSSGAYGFESSSRVELKYQATQTTGSERRVSLMVSKLKCGVRSSFATTRSTTHPCRIHHSRGELECPLQQTKIIVLIFLAPTCACRLFSLLWFIET